jgi:hypothetical protein
MADMNPNGVLGAAKDLNKPLETLGYLMTPAQLADVASEPPVTVRDPESLFRPPVQSSVYGNVDHRESGPATPVCPSPDMLEIYRRGGQIAEFGGHIAGFSGGGKWAAGKATNPEAVAAKAAGTLGKELSVPFVGLGTGMQLGAGAGIVYQTGNWRPLAAAGIPAIAGAVAELPWFGEPVSDALQKYTESHGPNYRDCLPSRR